MRLLTTMQFSRFWWGSFPETAYYVYQPPLPLSSRRREGTPFFAPESRVVILLVSALVLGSVVTLAAYRLRLLTVDGAMAALAVGTIILVAGGYGLVLILVLAFAASSILTRYRREEKGHPEHRRGRSASQILANGSVPAAFAVCWGFFDLPWALPAVVGAIAATTADTCATELGLLSPRPPRLITTAAVVERGRSGGITLLGTVSGIAGALFVAILGRVFLDPLVAPGILVGMIAGISGLFADSLLGATLQARWMTNDTVNLLATLVGAVVAALF